MTNIQFICPNCDSDNITLLESDLGKCKDCGEIFDLVDKLPPPKQYRSKPKDKFEDGD